MPAISVAMAATVHDGIRVSATGDFDGEDMYVAPCIFGAKPGWSWMRTSDVLCTPACDVLMRESRLVLALQEAHALQKARRVTAHSTVSSLSIARPGPTAMMLPALRDSAKDHDLPPLPNVPATLFGSPCLGYGGAAVAIVSRPRRLRSDDPRDVLVQIRGHMGSTSRGAPLADCTPPTATPMCSLAARLHQLSPTCWLCTVARPGLAADWFVVERAWAVANPRCVAELGGASPLVQPLWALIWSDALAPYVPPHWPHTANSLSGLGAFSGVDIHEAFGLVRACDDEGWARIFLSHDRLDDLFLGGWPRSSPCLVFGCEAVHRLRRSRRRELLSTLRVLGAMLELRTRAGMEPPPMARCVQSDNLLHVIVDAVGIDARSVPYLERCTRQGRDSFNIGVGKGSSSVLKQTNAASPLSGGRELVLTLSSRVGLRPKDLVLLRVLPRASRQCGRLLPSRPYP